MTLESRELKGARIYTRPEDSLPYYRIEKIRDDQSSPNLLTIISDSQGDAYLEMTDPKGEKRAIGFASLTGGSSISPVIAERIREIAYLMASDEGQIPRNPMLIKEIPPLGTHEAKGMKIRVEPDGLITIKNIRGDQGHGTTMNLTITTDGDAVIDLKDNQSDQILEMQFNSSHGGGAFPGISYVLRALARDLALLENS